MDPLPRTGNRRILAGNRFFDLVEEEIEDRNRQMYSYFTVASKWDAVLVVPVLGDGRLLIERIYRHPCRAWLHEFPAGGIEPGEDPCVAGGRELHEETGWTAARIVPLHSFEALPGLLRLRLHVVAAYGLVDTGSRALEAAEFIHVETVSRSAAWQLTRQETTSSFLTMGLLALEHAERATCPSA